MERSGYTKIPFCWITEEIITQYNFYSIVEPDGYIYFEVRKGMHRLKQSSRIDFDNIVKLLVPHGYLPVQESTSLWKHQTLPTVFTHHVPTILLSNPIQWSTLIISSMQP